MVQISERICPNEVEKGVAKVINNIQLLVPVNNSYSDEVQFQNDFIHLERVSIPHARGSALNFRHERLTASGCRTTCNWQEIKRGLQMIKVPIRIKGLYPTMILSIYWHLEASLIDLNASDPQWQQWGQNRIKSRFMMLIELIHNLSFKFHVSFKVLQVSLFLNPQGCLS